MLAVAGNWADLVGAAAPAPAPVTPKNEAEMPKDGVIPPKPDPMPVAPIRLTRLSFGAAAGYRDVYRGQPVLADDSDENIAESGLDLSKGVPAGKFAVAAYIRGRSTLKPRPANPYVRLTFKRGSNDRGEPYLVSAWRQVDGAADFQDPNTKVIDERQVTLADGDTVADLVQSKLPKSRAGMREEIWTVVARQSPNEAFDKALVLANVPVRIYATLQTPLEANGQSDSVYFIACNKVNASNQEDLQAQILKKFDQRNRVITAAGKFLTFGKLHADKGDENVYRDVDFFEFIVNGDGNGELWSELLQRVYSVHGLQLGISTITPDTNDNRLKNALPQFIGIPDPQINPADYLGILFANFRFKEKGKAAPEQPGDVVIPGQFTNKLALNPASQSSMAWAAPDATDLGRKGQGGEVVGQYRKHAIVYRPKNNIVPDRGIRENDIESYYDPAFAAGTFKDKIAYEVAMLEADPESRRTGSFYCVVGFRLFDGARKFFYGAVQDWETQQLKFELLTDPK